MKWITNINKFPFYRQMDQMDCGPTCLKMIAKFYGKNVELEMLRRKTGNSIEGSSLAGLLDGAQSINFDAVVLKVDFDTLNKEVPLPCVVHWNRGHYVVVYSITKSQIHIADPNYGLKEVSKSFFLNNWLKSDLDDNGLVLAIEPNSEFYYSKSKTDLYSYNWKSILKYLSKYKKEIFHLFLGLFVGSLIQLIFPFLTKAVVDYGINYKNINFIFLILIGQLILFLSQSFIELIRGWIILHITTRVKIELVSNFLGKLMRLSIQFFEGRHNGDIMQRIYDHKRIQDFLSITSINTLFSLITMIVFGGILIYYSKEIFIVFFLGSVLYIIWTLIFLKKRGNLDAEKFKIDSDNQAILYQLISGLPEIKLNGSEKKRRHKWEIIQKDLFNISIKSLTLSQTQDSGGKFLNEMKNILITFLAARSVIYGELTLGTMLSIQYIIGQLNVPINNFIQFVQLGQDAKLSIERLSEIQNQPDEEAIGESFQLPKKHDIILNKLSFRYGSERSPYVLQDLNLTIPQGKVTAIVGSSGSGKTTLVKLLLKFYDPTDGDILVGDFKFENLNTRNWRSSCASVMQDGFIFDDTIANNISESEIKKYIDIGKLRESARLANIDDFIESLPLGYETELGSKGIYLSGGQKQRILIARAIYKDPNFIFFDEATSALDANNEKIIMNNLNLFYKGRTAVVVAHRLSTVINADQIILLDNGRLIEKGTHKELIKTRGSYFTLVKNQLELNN